LPPERRRGNAQLVAVAAGFTAAALIGFAYVVWVSRLDLRSGSCRPPWELTALSFVPFGAFSVALAPLFLTASSIAGRRGPTVVASFVAASLVLLALVGVAFIAYMDIGVAIACD
jgi:branched-subunit amino acid transport protein